MRTMPLTAFMMRPMLAGLRRLLYGIAILALLLRPATGNAETGSSHARRAILTLQDSTTIRVELLAVHGSDLVVTKMVDPSEEEITSHPERLIVVSLAGIRKAVLAGHGNLGIGSGVGALAGMLIGAKLAINAEGGSDLASDKAASVGELGAVMGAIPGALVGAMIGAAVITGEEELDLADPVQRQHLFDQARFQPDTEPPVVRELGAGPP